MLTREDRRRSARSRRAAEPGAGARPLGWRGLALAAALCLGAGLSLGKPEALERVSLRLEDGKFALRAFLGADPKPDVGVVLVAIDAPSVSTVGRWPWPRDVLASLVTRLRAADLVGLEMSFPQGAGPEQDGALAAAMDGGGVVLGYRLREVSGPARSPLTSDQLDSYAYPSSAVRSPVVGVREFEASEGNVSTLAEAALSAGFLNLEPDPDGRYRTYPLAYVHKGRLLPSLAVQLVQYRLDRKARLVLDRSGIRSLELGAVRLSRTRGLPLNFPDPGQVSQVSAAAVLAGSVPSSAFRGKVVLVGVTAPSAAELRPTPLEPEAPSVFLHFTAVSNLLRSSFLRESRSLDAALLVVSCFLVLGASLADSLRGRLLLYLPALLLPQVLSAVLLTAMKLRLHESHAFAAALFLALLLEGTAALRPLLARLTSPRSSTDA